MLLYKPILKFVVLGLFGVAAAKPPCKSGSWVNLTSIPEPRQEHGAAVRGNTTVAILGGIVPVGNATETTDLFQLYDIASNTWSTKSPAPYKVSHPNIAVVGEKLYFLGGLIEGPTTPKLSMNWVASRICYVYGFSTNEWSEIAPMPNGTELGSSIVGVHGDMIYLAGGMTVLQTGYQDAVDSVLSFNTTSGAWQRVDHASAELPESRQHATGGVIGNTFYVVGGRRCGQLYTRDTVFELDLTQQQTGWKLSKGHMPTSRGGINGAAVDQRFYVFGGEGNLDATTGVFNQSEAFDVRAQTWSELKPMVVPRHGTQAGSAGGRVYIPGGGLQQDGKQVVKGGKVTSQNPTSHFDAYCA